MDIKYFAYTKTDISDVITMIGQEKRLHGDDSYYYNIVRNGEKRLMGVNGLMHAQIKDFLEGTNFIVKRDRFGKYHVEKV